MASLRWERINSEADEEITQRLKVFGGWLVLTTVVMEEVATAAAEYGPYRDDISVIAQSFIPDSKHEWLL